MLDSLIKAINVPKIKENNHYPIVAMCKRLLNDSNVNIAIYDLLGNNIVELYNGYQTSGNKNVMWDARNILGEPVSAGMQVTARIV